MSRVRIVGVVGAVIGAFAAVGALTGEAGPTPLDPNGLGRSVLAIAAFLGIALLGVRVVRTATRRDWAWGLGVGIAFATLWVIGASLETTDSLAYLRPDSGVAGSVVVLWLGVGWVAAAGTAGVLSAFRGAATTRRPVAVRRLSGRSRFLVLLGVLLVPRIVYLALFWPGTVAFDSFHAYQEWRGLEPWGAWEPVGHSILVGIMQWFGPAVGLGDAGAVAIGASLQALSTAAVGAFALLRMASWGVDRRIWWAAVVWFAASPVLDSYGIRILKDVPFASAFTLFVVALVEILLTAKGASRRWPWVLLAGAGLAMILVRNNGVFIVLGTLALLLVVSRRLWRRWLVVLLVSAAGYGLYVGPLYAALGVQATGPTEAFSIPIQQLGRIARDAGPSLTDADREFYETIFGMPVEEVGETYNPRISDPLKTAVNRAWGTRSAGDLFAGWARLALAHPADAVEATLANTYGIWYAGATMWYGTLPAGSDDPTGYYHVVIDGVPAWSSGSGLVGWAREHGLVADGTASVPIVGALGTCAFVCWAWTISAIGAGRGRRIALAVFVPAGILLATALAGPVVDVRYVLPLFAALPIALAAATAPRRGEEADAG
ncbi:MAG: hypothetical protein J7480_01225 [Microbacteriaceae bacterium]|nr:hypothetical protein [Microbacteriaceae bacterium]